LIRNDLNYEITRLSNYKILMASFSSARQSPQRSRRDEGGYILLTLLFMVTLLVVAAAAILPTVAFNIRRDREQELIHRGVQYSRAIRAYYKKFGRYPTRMEDLESTNNLRFLRKRYKDPVTGQDFKLLHYGDPTVKLSSSIGGGSIPGANPAGSPTGANGSGPGGTGFGSSGSGFGSSGSGFGSSGSGFGSGSGVNNSGVFSQSSGFGGNSNSGFGANANAQAPSGQQPANAPTGTDASSQASSQTSGTQGTNGSGDDKVSGQVFGGGPIVGVVSTSKKDTIREFNKKKKYSDWQFVYDPTLDRGGLITTPNQPALQGAGNLQGPGQGTQPGSSSSSPFGQATGFGSNPNSMGGPAAPAQPISNPPQPQ
jgi:type II secretory pathway pseudopilin PulG